MATQSRKEAAIGFLTLVASGDVREAYQQYVGQGFAITTRLAPNPPDLPPYFRW